MKEVMKLKNKSEDKGKLESYTFIRRQNTAVSTTAVAIAILTPADQTFVPWSLKMSSSGQLSLQRGPEHIPWKAIPPSDPLWYQTCRASLIV